MCCCGHAAIGSEARYAQKSTRLRWDRASSRMGTELNPLLSFAPTLFILACHRGHTVETLRWPLPEGHFCPSSLLTGARAVHVYGFLKLAASLFQICELVSSNVTALSKPLSFAKWGVSQGEVVPDQGWCLCGS